MSQEESIKESLKNYGFNVDKIPERKDIKTPDFYATKDEDEYTIELKTKYMNLGVIEDMKTAFDKDEIYSGIIPLDRTQKHQKVIHGAKKQLAAEPLYPESFHIAWFHCEGHDASTTMELFENSLYGKEYVVDWEDGTNKAYECYYFKSNAMFAKYKDILDGAVITTNDSIKVLLNVYSPKYEALKNSSLCSTFGGVQDPVERENMGEALLVDEGIDRSNLVAEVKKKYNLNTLKAIPMNVCSVTSLIPK